MAGTHHAEHGRDEEAMMGRVVHFELPADDPARAVSFYRDVFGWQVQGEEGVEYYLATTGGEGEPGINGAILRRTAPVTRLVSTIQVQSLNDTLQLLKSAGGAVIDGKRAVPGIGWHAYCEDCEGNVIGVLEADSSAA
jgi:predicted enzyme related to lactoylglutathione lyase